MFQKKSRITTKFKNYQKNSKILKIFNSLEAVNPFGLVFVGISETYEMGRQSAHPGFARIEKTTEKNRNYYYLPTQLASPPSFR